MCLQLLYFKNYFRYIKINKIFDKTVKHFFQGNNDIGRKISDGIGGFYGKVKRFNERIGGREGGAEGNSERKN